MEREQFHYHVDIMSVDARLLDSSEPLPKAAAERLFRQKVEEFRPQVGRFVIRPANESDWEERGLVGAVRVATNHRLIISLTRCDCD